MEKKYTILDFSEEFNKDKQLIRRRLSKLEIKAMNRDQREYENEPLKYNYEAYLKLAKDFGVLNIEKDQHEDDTQCNTHDMQNDTQCNAHRYADNMVKDKIIEILERELEHSKVKLEKAEQEKDNLYRLLNQQQQLSLSDKNKIEILELELKENIDPVEAFEEKKIEKKEFNNKKWYDVFKRKK